MSSLKLDRLESYLKHFLWFSIVFLYFFPVYYYIFLLDIIILLILGLKIINKDKFLLNKNFLIIFSTFFIGVSLLLPFYNPIFPPFVFISLLFYLFLFILTDINFEQLKPILLILPFVAIPYSLIKKQAEFSFIYKNNSILGFLLILGFVFFRKNKILAPILLLSIFLTFSKTSYLALFLILIYFLLENSGKRKGIITLFFIPILIILIFLFYRAALNEPFFGSRIKIWKTAILTGINNLPFGVGGFNFNYYSDEYRDVKKTIIGDNFEFYKKYLKNKVKLDVFNIKRVRYEHNLYLKLFTEYGIFGFLLAMIVLFRMFTLLRKGDEEKKLLIIVFFVFSMIQNFSLSYVFFLPFFILLIKDNKSSESIKIRKSNILLFTAFYFFLFSLPLFFNDFFIFKSIPEYSKKIVPFDYRGYYIDFRNSFNLLKKNPTIKNLYLLDLKAGEVLSLNKRVEYVYSLLSFSFYNFLNKNLKIDTPIKRKAFYYSTKWLSLNPHNPVALLHIGKIHIKEGKLKTAKKIILRSLKIEPFYLKALIEIKNIYIKEQEKEKVEFLEKLIKKIKKERANYKFKGSSLYEREIIYDE